MEESLEMHLRIVTIKFGVRNIFLGVADHLLYCARTNLCFLCSGKFVCDANILSMCGIMYNRGGVCPARRDWVTVNRRLNVIILF